MYQLKISWLNMSNIKILQKCVDELNKEGADLSYVKGMLETLIDLGGGISSLDAPASTNIPLGISIPPSSINNVPYIPVDEEEFNETAAKYAGGPLGRIG